MKNKKAKKESKVTVGQYTVDFADSRSDLQCLGMQSRQDSGDAVQLLLKVDLV